MITYFIKYWEKKQTTLLQFMVNFSLIKTTSLSQHNYIDQTEFRKQDSSNSVINPILFGLDSYNFLTNQNTDRHEKKKNKQNIKLDNMYRTV